MGFSIGSFLKTIAGPVIGGLLGGPAGAFAGSAISSGFLSQRGGPAARRFPSTPGPTTVAFPAPIIRGGAAAATALGALSLFGNGNGMTVTELLKLSKENTGRPASTRKIREAARVCGIEIAAETFGLSETQICFIIVSRRSRRGRGISAADMRRTRSTIRKISTLQHNLAHLVAHTKGRARGSGGRYI